MRKTIELRIPTGLAMEIGWNAYLQESLKRISRAGIPIKVTARPDGKLNFLGVLHGKLHAYMDGTDRVYVWTPSPESRDDIMQYQQPDITGDIIFPGDANAR